MAAMHEIVRTGRDAINNDVASVLARARSYESLPQTDVSRGQGRIPRLTPQSRASPQTDPDVWCIANTWSSGAHTQLEPP